MFLPDAILCVSCEWIYTPEDGIECPKCNSISGLKLRETVGTTREPFHGVDVEAMRKKDPFTVTTWVDTVTRTKKNSEEE